MRVCILHRPNATSGGDWVAQKGYVLGLQSKGIDVETRPANKIGDLKDFDFAHLWAACSPDWGLPAAREAKRQNAKLIITPFWWSRAERQTHYGKAGMDLAPGYTPAVAETLKLADVLFTVTVSEAHQCLQLAGTTNWRIVPMGIEVLGEALPPDDYVLCIGRIEPHKNQHALAEACNKLGHRLVLFGQTTSEGYTNLVKDRGGWVVSFASGDDYHKKVWLQKARVHALPSFFENPGLSHGEALAIGIPAVMGGHGCELEFYGASGLYCDPTSVSSIAASIETAWSIQRRPPVILPTWSDAADKAIEAMESL